MPLDNYLASPLSPVGMAPTRQQPIEGPRYGQGTGATMVKSSLEELLNPNSSYIQNARQRGMEVAAERGGLNSSIAAGAAERAAMDAAAPLASAAVAIDTQRDTVASQNWLNQQGFDRDFQGQLALMPLNNSMNMLNMVTQYAMNDPAMYGPDVISGYSNFFNSNMKDLMSQYFQGP